MEDVITTIVENDLVICELDTALPVLKHRWLRKASSEEFRSQLQQIQKEYVRLSADHPSLMWLADTELMGERSPEDEKWLEEVWEEMIFVEAGVKVHAVVLSNDIYADYSMEKFKVLADGKFEELGVRLGVFMDTTSAYEWMKEQGS